MTVIVACSLLLCPGSVLAQASVHPCDVPQPTSLGARGSQTAFTLAWCEPVTTPAITEARVIRTAPPVATITDAALPNISLPNLTGSWTWFRHASGVVMLPAGETVLSLWSREAGLRIDRIVLTTAITVPVSIGPLESAKDPEGRFIESGGTVAIEAEHPAASVTQGGAAWVVQANPAGLVGDAIQAQPDTDAILDLNYATTSAQVRYRIAVTTPGNYLLWLRGSAARQTDNSLHAGVTSTRLSAGGAVETIEPVTVGTDANAEGLVLVSHTRRESAIGTYAYQVRGYGLSNVVTVQIVPAGVPAAVASVRISP